MTSGRGSRRRRLWLLAVGLPLLATLVDAAFWQVASQRLELGFKAWLIQARSAGWAIQVGTQRTGGWPFAAALTIDGLSIEGARADIPGGADWTAETVTLRIGLLTPRVLEIDAGNRQTLRIAGGPAIPFTAERLTLRLLLSATPVPRSLDVHCSGLQADMPTTGNPIVPLTIGQFRGHADLNPDAQQGEAAIALSFSLESAGLPSGFKWPLGPRISAFSIEGAVEGPVPNATDLTTAATTWRDGGGSVEIQRLALGWGPLGLAASATLALDDQLQPMGAGNSHVVGYAAALDALASNGALSRSAATAAKAVLSLLASSGADDDPPAVDVPLTLQYRTLSMRQVPLLRLPELDWPSP